jgi:hypothetical protein
MNYIFLFVYCTLTDSNKEKSVLRIQIRIEFFSFNFFSVNLFPIFVHHNPDLL